METDKTRAEKLLGDYNFYRTHTDNYQKQLQARPYMRELKGTPDRLQLFNRLDQWCIVNGLDSRRFLYAQFKKHKWLFAPPVNRLLPGKKSLKVAIERYHILKEAPLLTNRLNAEHEHAQQMRGEIFSINRDVSYAAEALKRRYSYVNQLERCIDEMFTKTYGYHPKSRVCLNCVEAHRCMEKLRASVPFDIVGLRQGRITLQECRMIAGQTRNVR